MSAHAAEVGRRPAGEAPALDLDALEARRLDELTVDELRAHGDPVVHVEELFARHDEGGRRRAAAAALRAALRLDRPAERAAVEARLLAGRLGLARPEAARPVLERLLASARRKVVHLHGWWGVGGAERLVASVAAATADALDTVLVTYEMPPGTLGFPVHPSVHRLEVRSGEGWLRSLAALAIGLGTDLAVLHPTYVLGLHRVVERLARAEVRTIAAHYGTRYLGAISPVLYPLHLAEWPALWRTADAVLWIGRSSAALCATSCDRVHHVPALIEPVPDPGDKPRGAAPRLLAVGRHDDALKRVDRLLAVFERILVRHPRACLSLVGPCSLELRCEPGGPTLGELLARLGPTRKQVQLVGSVPDVRAHYLAADLLLHASEFEGTPLVFIEAGLHRLPVVAAEFLDAGDLVTDGVNGRLTAQGDLDAMALAASDLLDDDGARRAMGARGRELALRFRPELVLPRWRRVIDAVLEHGQGASRVAHEDHVTPAGLDTEGARRAAQEAERSMARLMREVMAQAERGEELRRGREELRVELSRALTRPPPGLHGVVHDTLKSLREDGLTTTRRRIASRLAGLVARRGRPGRASGP